MTIPAEICCRLGLYLWIMLYRWGGTSDLTNLSAVAGFLASVFISQGMLNMSGNPDTWAGCSERYMGSNRTIRQVYTVPKQWFQYMEIWGHLCRATSYVPAVSTSDLQSGPWFTWAYWCILTNWVMYWLRSGCAYVPHIRSLCFYQRLLLEVDSLTSRLSDHSILDRHLATVTSGQEEEQ